MNLWVRSQDKKHLMKCEAIMCEETGIGYGLRAFTKNYDFDIGTYKTKERAIEVLDEIQNKINLINLEHDLGSPMIDLKNPAYIYQMPKN